LIDCSTATERTPFNPKIPETQRKQSNVYIRDSRPAALSVSHWQQLQMAPKKAGPVPMEVDEQAPQGELQLA
jgi:hypothetical protein